MGTLLIAAMAMSGTTCTMLLDHNAVQCKSENDCVHLGNHPLCQNGLCVPSRLQPDGCFLVNPPTVPMTQPDFLNACSVNAMQAGLSDPVGSCLTFGTKFDPGATTNTPPMTPTNATKLATAPTSLCTSLVPAGKQILYISGSSNFAPLLQELSQVIVNTISIVPVFRTTQSCIGVKSMNPMSSTYGDDHIIKDPIGTPGTIDTTDKYPTWAQIYLGDGRPSVPCLLGKDGVPLDLGESEIAQDTCGMPANPTDLVGESLGPILPIIFAVPKYSSQKVISSAAAYQVFGGGGGVPPWEDPHFLYIRAQGTATLRLVAKQIGLPFNQFWGTDQGSAAAMAANLGALTSSDANLALGIIGTDYYDQPENRNVLKALGFQASDQDCAYLPDSTLTSLDKINVRDGHYPLWGRIHFFAARSNGQLTSAAAAPFLKLFANPVLDPDIFKALIKAGFVPPCAMKVTRSEELGDFTYADPPVVNCTCAFDAQVGAQMQSYCKMCNDNTDCMPDRPSCRYGYCERESS
jgi:hypothetical protein